MTGADEYIMNQLARLEADVSRLKAVVFPTLEPTHFVCDRCAGDDNEREDKE